MNQTFKLTQALSNARNSVYAMKQELQFYKSYSNLIRDLITYVTANGVDFKDVNHYIKFYSEFDEFVERYGNVVTSSEEKLFALEEEAKKYL